MIFSMRDTVIGTSLFLSKICSGTKIKHIKIFGPCSKSLIKIIYSSTSTLHLFSPDSYIALYREGFPYWLWIYRLLLFCIKEDITDSVVNKGQLYRLIRSPYISGVCRIIKTHIIKENSHESKHGLFIWSYFKWGVIYSSAISKVLARGDESEKLRRFFFRCGCSGSLFLSLSHGYLRIRRYL